jgi:hypothetical protein
MNRGWKRALHYLFCTLQEKLPPGFQFRVLGDDGNEYWEQVEDVKAISGQYDFEIDGNSANSNKGIQQAVADGILQLVGNPLFLQLGIVTPANVFNALKNKLSVDGVKEFSRYITKPQGDTVIYSPEEIANSVLAGIDVKLNPQQDLAGFVAYFEHVMEHDEILGQFSEAQTVALAKKYQEAQALMQALQAQQAQVANVNQIKQNSAMTTGMDGSAGQGAPQAAAQPQMPTE